MRTKGKRPTLFDDKTGFFPVLIGIFKNCFNWLSLEKNSQHIQLLVKLTICLHA